MIRERIYPLTRGQMETHLTLRGFFAARIGPVGIAREGLHFFFTHRVAGSHEVLVDYASGHIQPDYYRQYEKAWDSLDDTTFWRLALHIVGLGLC